MSSKRYDVIGLFLVADLVCATAVLPVYLGLMTEDYKFIPAPTEAGAFLGIWSGIVAVVVNGYVNDFDQAVSYGEVIATGPFSYFWLTNSTECALCGTRTMVTFIIVPLVAGFFTLFFSKIDIMIRGDRAREPIFKIGHAEPEAKNYNLAGDVDEGAEVQDDKPKEVDGASDGTEEEGGAVEVTEEAAVEVS